MKKRMLVVLSILLIGSIFIAACSTGQAPADAPADEETMEEKPAEEEAMEEKLKCALVVPGPLGDRSFSDSAARGIEKANAELPVDCDIIETTGVPEHETAVRSAVAEGYDLVLTLALDQEMVLAVAKEYPEVKFSNPSSVWNLEIVPNITTYLIEVHESSFLVGLIAGYMTDTKKVGAVVGGDNPGMNQFTYGFEHGVAEACPECEVFVGYLGFDFNNPTLGLETALGIYDQGADIVFQVAGRSGEGVLEASAQRGLYSIGVDSNQDWVQPGSVIVSMIKRVDLAVLAGIESVLDGTYEGGTYVVGMPDLFAGISWDEGSTTFRDEGPADMVAKMDGALALVEEYREKVRNDEFVICDSLSNLETVQPECEPFWDAPAE